MENTEKQITETIKKARAGQIFFNEDFRDKGTGEAVKVALHRLVKRNVLQRIARGIYAKPYYSELIEKEVTPGADEVAKAVALRDKARIIPTGVYALNALGLSTQVPMKLVYLTDAAPRKMRIGKATILFKRTTAKNLSYQSELCMLVVQALKEIGIGKVRKEEENKIIGLLKKVDYSQLKHDIGIAPQWIAEIMAKALKQ
jgi:hypothetical protein